MQFCIKKAVNLLKSGFIIIIETDTVHALTCDAHNQKAVLNIYRIKNRPFHKRLPIFVKNIEQAAYYAMFDKTALRIAESFWPGALTLVLPIADHNALLAPALYQNMTSIAVRVPNSYFVLKLIENIKHPIVGTSANLSGEITQLYEKDIRKVFGNRIHILVSNKKLTFKKKPSTILCFNSGQPKIIREGSISLNKIINVLNKYN